MHRAAARERTVIFLLCFYCAPPLGGWHNLAAGLVLLLPEIVSPESSELSGALELAEEPSDVARAVLKALAPPNAFVINLSMKSSSPKLRGSTRPFEPIESMKQIDEIQMTLCTPSALMYPSAPTSFISETSNKYTTS
jgi:hypothetical protein